MLLAIFCHCKGRFMSPDRKPVTDIIKEDPGKKITELMKVLLGLPIDAIRIV